MRAYWQQLQLREQRLIIIAAILLLIMALYSTIIAPLTEAYEATQIKVRQQRVLLMDIQQAAKELKPLRAGNRRKGGENQSLLSRVDTSARRSKLQESMKRIEPDGKTRVRIWMEKVPFDQVMSWLQSLSQQGIRVETLESERLDAEGRVNIRLVLES